MDKTAEAHTAKLFTIDGQLGSLPGVEARNSYGLTRRDPQRLTTGNRARIVPPWRS